DDMFIAGQYAGRLGNMASALNELHDYRRAGEVLAEAIAVLDHITARDPADDDAKLSLALSHTHLATTHLRSGNPAAALQEGRRAEVLYTTLPEAARNATEALAAQRDNYHGLAQAATASTVRGVATDACSFYRQGLRMAEAIDRSVGTAPGEFT